MYLTIATKESVTFYYLSKAEPRNISTGLTRIDGAATLYQSYDDFYHSTEGTPVSAVILEGFATSTQKMVDGEEA